MNNYVIYTDTGCDISPEILEKWEVGCLSLTFRFNDDNIEYLNNDMDAETFYQRMRDGAIAKTAAVNPELAEEMFEKELVAGNDILYIGFSTGLSTTYNAARIAAEALADKYPQRRIVAVDTLAASAGEGMLLYMATQKKKAGLSIDENAAYIESMKLKLCHWFTVDDLVYLKRGGRISPTVAFVGNMLGIKPVLHVDNEGHLVNVFKVRGRRASIEALADKYIEQASDIENGLIYISHADSKADAETLAELIKKKSGNEVSLITNVGTVIGAHSGPGTIALFFVGKER